MWTAARLRALRQDLDESQQAFSIRLRVMPGTIGDFEQGLRPIPEHHFETLDRLEAPLLCKKCNCALCETELLGESMAGWLHGRDPAEQQQLPALVAGRVEGRPYCQECLALAKAKDVA